MPLRDVVHVGGLRGREGGAVTAPDDLSLPAVGSQWADPKGRVWRVDRVDGDPALPDFCEVRLSLRTGDGLTHDRRHTLAYLRRFWCEVTP